MMRILIIPAAQTDLFHRYMGLEYVKEKYEHNTYLSLNTVTALYLFNFDSYVCFPIIDNVHFKLS